MASTIRTILVPVDGSKHAAAAARYADSLARKINARVELLHAFPESPRALMERLGNTTEQALAGPLSSDAFSGIRKESASRAFSNARSLLPGGAVSMEEVIVDGEPAEALAEHAKKVDSPIIIMGRRGLGRVREFLVGSVSEGVILRATCPVTVISDDDVVATSAYIVPVDGSKSALVAVRHAAGLASATGASIHLLHVFPNTPREIPGVGGSMAELAGVGPFADESFAELGRESAERAFKQARKEIGDDSIEVVNVRRGGDPATAINAYSRELGEAEIVMGRRGLSRLEAFVMGSVSRRVVHGAFCPVTVLH